MRDNVSFSLVKFFIIFRHWARMFRPPHFFSAWLSKFDSPPPLEHFENKKFFKKKSSLRFRTWKETSSALCEKHSRRGCQPQSTSSQGSFGGKYFIENVFFCLFFGPWLKHSRFLSDKIQSGYQYAFYVSIKEFGREQKGKLIENFSNLEENSAPVLSKHQFTCSWEQFERKIFLETISIFKNLRLLSGKKFGFCQKWFGLVVEFSFYVSIAKIWDKDLGWTFFQTLIRKSSV